MASSQNSFQQVATREDIPKRSNPTIIDLDTDKENLGMDSFSQPNPITIYLNKTKLDCVDRMYARSYKRRKKIVTMPVPSPPTPIFFQNLASGPPSPHPSSKNTLLSIPHYDTPLFSLPSHIIPFTKIKLQLIRPSQNMHIHNHMFTEPTWCKGTPSFMFESLSISQMMIGPMAQRKAIFTTKLRWKRMYHTYYKHQYEKLEIIIEDEPDKEDKHKANY